MEEILAKIVDKAPEVLSFMKKEILEAVGPAGLMIAIAAVLAIVVYSVISLVKFVFRVVLYIVIPAILAYVIIQILDPSFLKTF